MHVTMYSTKYWDITDDDSPPATTSPRRRPAASAARCVPEHGLRRLRHRRLPAVLPAGSRSLDHRETMHTHYTPSDTVVCS